MTRTDASLAAGAQCAHTARQVEERAVDASEFSKPLAAALDQALGLPACQVHEEKSVARCCPFDAQSENRMRTRGAFIQRSGSGRPQLGARGEDVHRLSYVLAGLLRDIRHEGAEARVVVHRWPVQAAQLARLTP
eukprot:CAMPEP_0170643966 /NCGR_PEP_ID=MMETSP0224-20130122/42203_1 /TAXON_ID=285029 /ORGANISM="Togula jolla, Strain CCCM 725" /LENGTH=134 /DNA_ID=CAMNT_0010974901 /DNA_START=368 /DNA_END=772 /DNA_ORIENTATION=+